VSDGGAAAGPRRHARWKPVAAAFGAALGVALLGGLTTEIGPWYRSLVEPPWKPPDIWFGPAWTLIFACAAMAGLTAWRHETSRSMREWIIGLFALNAFLNVGWSLLFFRLHRPDWALLEVVLLWLSIVLLIVVLRRISTASAWWLAPYLAWVTFAAALNRAVVELNAPFGG